MTSTQNTFEQILTTFDLTLDRNSLLLCHALLAEADERQSTDQAAHMGGQLYSAAIAGKLLATLHQGNLLSAELHPQLQQIETTLMADMAAQFNFPLGHFTSGSSIGNLEALWLAKQRRPTRKHVYTSENGHYSINKACALLDLQLVMLPSNQYHQLDIGVLKDACEAQPPLAIIANAGNTSSGHMDPLSAVVKLAGQYQSWLHIDAAWGGFLAFLNDPALLAAASQADSLCFDPHKSLGQPRPCGLLFYRQPLPKIAATADYLQQTPDSRVIGSRGGEQFLPLWLTFHHHGLKTLQTDLTAKLTEARKMADLLTGKVADLLLSDTGIVCFQHPDDLQPLLDAGVISQTRLKHQHYHRLVFADKACHADAVFRRLAPFL
ncbi:MAG: aminotransferase class V-fold PLP-dependent enzyme [Methylophaga sp.]|nr:aminotransferase class V-fold PLP-dependent enzyme [Methylophaga sp.]